MKLKLEALRRIIREEAAVRITELKVDVVSNPNKVALKDLEDEDVDVSTLTFGKGRTPYGMKLMYGHSNVMEYFYDSDDGWNKLPNDSFVIGGEKEKVKNTTREERDQQRLVAARENIEDMLDSDPQEHPLYDLLRKRGYPEGATYGIMARRLGDYMNADTDNEGEGEVYSDYTKIPELTR